jgi:hypothetical protein
VKLKLPVIILTAIAIVGCAPKKKSPDTSPMPAAGSVLNVPGTPSAPAASYTPPPAPQPVVYDTPQQREQPVGCVQFASRDDHARAYARSFGRPDPSRRSEIDREARQRQLEIHDQEG